MAIGTAIKGSSVFSSATFYNADGTPFVATSPVRWVVRDFNNNQVASGVASQNIRVPAQWTCTFTLATTVPTTDNNSYSLVWLATNAQSTQAATEYFAVQDELQPEPYESAQIVLLGAAFTAQLWLPTQAATLSLRICDTRGNILYVQNGTTNFQSTPTNRGWMYSIPINVTNPGDTPYLNEGRVNSPPQSGGVNSLFLYWNYTDSQANPETVINRLYVLNGTIIRLMDDMRRFVDRIRNAASIPQLRLTDIDLAHFALQGMDMFNGTPPVNNGLWGLGCLPEPFYDNVKQAACIRFLQAQTLATGMAAFEFSGQAVSLNSDQTQYLQQLEQSLTAEYDAKASKNKNHMARSRFFAAIGGHFGPTSLIVGRVPYGYANFLFPSLPFLG